MVQNNQIKHAGQTPLHHHHGGENPLVDFLGDRWPLVAAACAAAILLSAAVYGALYYTEARRDAAQVGLYQARKIVPATGATEAQAEAGIEALNALVAAGGPADVMAQAYLELAALHGRSGRYQESYDEYAMAKAAAAADSFFSSLADAGRANSLFRLGKYDEAATIYGLVADSGGAYPKGPLFYGMAVSQAMAGKKEAAIGALTRLKNEAPDYMPSDVVDDLSRRIDGDEFASLPAPEATVSEAPLGVHTGQ
jgi:tetratricopeptide (TPR) repeat protein